MQRCQQTIKCYVFPFLFSNLFKPATKNTCCHPRFPIVTPHYRKVISFHIVCFECSWIGSISNNKRFQFSPCALQQNKTVILYFDLGPPLQISPFSINERFGNQQQYTLVSSALNMSSAAKPEVMSGNLRFQSCATCVSTPLDSPHRTLKIMLLHLQKPSNHPLLAQICFKSLLDEK